MSEFLSKVKEGVRHLMRRGSAENVAAAADDAPAGDAAAAAAPAAAAESGASAAPPLMLPATDFRALRLQRFSNAAASGATSDAASASSDASAAGSARVSLATPPQDVPAQPQQQQQQQQQQQGSRPVTSTSAPLGNVREESQSPVAAALGDPWNRAVPKAASSAVPLSVSPADAAGSSSTSTPRNNSSDKRTKVAPGKNAWTRDMLAKLFRMSTPGSHGDSSLVDIGELSSDAASNWEDMTLAKIVDNCMLVRLMQLTDMAPFAFLLECYNRCIDQARLERSLKLERNVAQLDECMNIVARLAGTAVLEPDMFPSPHTSSAGPMQLLQIVLDAGASEPKMQLLRQIIDNNTENLQDLFEPILSNLSRTLAKKSLLDEHLTYMRALRLLTADNRLAAVAARLESFLPQGASGADLEERSFLGPLFRFTSLVDHLIEVRDQYFTDVVVRRGDAHSQVLAVQADIREANKVASKVLFQLLRCRESRQPTLDWIAYALNVNAPRTKLVQSAQARTSRDAFMINLGFALLELCEPFMNVSLPKSTDMISKIDARYAVSTFAPVSFNETRLSAETDAVASYAASSRANDPAIDFHFVCNCFFMAMRSLQLGYALTWPKYQSLVQRLNELSHLAESDAAVGAEFEQLLANKLCCDAHLLEPTLVSHTMQMLELACFWMYKLAAPQGAFDASPPAAFAALPESFIELPISFVIFVSRFDPPSLSAAPMQHLMTLLVDMIPRPKFVRNPHLRAQIAELLHGLRQAGAPALPLFDNHLAVRQRLVTSLMVMFVDVEHTGADSQFYDKFTIRYHIAYVIEQLWESEHYRNQIREDAKSGDTWLRFCNMMFNDLIYLLDESLSKLQGIHELEVLFDDADAYATLPADQRREYETKMKQYERQAQACTQLGNVMIHLLAFLSDEIRAEFCVPQLVSRMAEMCNYYLKLLVGPKFTDLKVKNPDKYNFHPRELLKDLLSVYVHLSSQPMFVEAVSLDTRSFSRDVFRHAIHIARSKQLLGSSELFALERFCEAATSAAQTTADEEELLGEVPDEFTDAISFTLMRDPVRLPSGVVTDRDTIERHLLSDPIDPFTRAPLTVEQLEPLPELKQRIEAWKEERLRGR